MVNNLAIDGGVPLITQPPPQPQRWGELERNQLDQMLHQSSLFYWRGPQTQLLSQRFREYYPLQHIMPCSSGTAAIHIATAAAGIAPGDEVITSPITDMGTVIGILYQQGVPVFADLHPHSYNLDPLDVARKITPRTKAVIAVHLAGNPWGISALKTLCEEHNLILIEDCAQAWGATHQSTPVGLFGDIACYSLNDFKHISCGDGGIVASNDERFGPLLQKFGDKAYDRVGGARMPDLLAPNYRMSEPQSAIAAAQMTRMRDITERRHQAGLLLTKQLSSIPGINVHHVDEGDRCTYWFYLLRLDPNSFSCDRNTFAAALAAEGVPCGAGYIAAPVYRYPVFQNHNFFGGRWPVRELGLTEMDYRQVSCPVSETILESSIQITINEAMDEEWIKNVGEAVRKVATQYARA